MAQIIKHRRGSISALKDVSANVGELVMGTGSIGDLNAPVLFIGDTAVAGGYKPVSKIYQGTTVPTITVGSHGSTMDGLPFYSTGTKTLYILDKSGNSAINLTGNIEGNTISGVTINSLTGIKANITSVTGSNGNFTNLTGTTFTSTNGNITSLTGSNANVTNLTGTTFTSTNGNITSLTGSNANVTNLTGTTFTSTNGNITSLTGSNAFVTNITGTTITGSNVQITNDLNVGGKVTVTGDISGSNLNLTGNATIDGNIVLKGNISIGDQNTDLVTFGADVSSSILPDVHNAFDLGSSDKNWRNLHVSGTAYVQALQVNQVTVTNINVTQDLRVSGSTFLGNGGDITVISGSIYNDQLTNKRVVFAGVRGVLGDDANFTFESTTLKVGNGNFEVGVYSGDIRTSGSQYINTNLFVGGNGKVTGSLEVVGATTLDSTLAVTGAATLKSTLEVIGATTLDSTLAVTGAAILKNNLNVYGDSSTTGSQYINTNLFVGGNGKVTGSFEVVGATSLDSTLVVTGSSTLKSTLEVQGVTNLDSSLNVTGSVLMKDTLIVSGNTTVGGNINLAGNLYVSGNLEILNGSSFVHISSSVIELDDNILRLNAYSPFLRYAGIEVIDSGSAGVSASMVWDSQNDYWMFSSGSGQTSKFIGTTYGSYGSEVSLTTNTIPKATSANTVGDSLLSENGTRLTYNTNKFSVESSDGATLIAGNVTVSAAGGADSGTKTSRVVFRNSSNVLGYVSATESTDVLDGILGYKNSDGALKFSTVIDGGTY